MFTGFQSFRVLNSSTRCTGFLCPLDFYHQVANRAQILKSMMYFLDWRVWSRGEINRYILKVVFNL